MIKLTVTLLLLCQIARGDDSTSNSLSESIDSQSNEDTFAARVIGGQSDKRGQYKYVARLTIYSSNGAGLCSGTVLSNSVILTAAHCVISNGIKAYAISARIENKIYLFNSNEMYPHPDYNSNSFSNDIAVLKLSNGRQKIKNIGSPPRLPTNAKAEFRRQKAVVAGWGKTSDAGGASATLQYANVDTISNNLCESYYGQIVNPGIICSLNRGKGICGGDSGGPLMVKKGNINYIVGVNAFGPAKCEYYLPSGYTYVPFFIDWIGTIIN